MTQACLALIFIYMTIRRNHLISQKCLSIGRLSCRKSRISIKLERIFISEMNFQQAIRMVTVTLLLKCGHQMTIAQTLRRVSLRITPILYFMSVLSLSIIHLALMTRIHLSCLISRIEINMCMETLMTM